jgi:hypothetical protein
MVENEFVEIFQAIWMKKRNDLYKRFEKLIRKNKR